MKTCLTIHKTSQPVNPRNIVVNQTINRNSYPEWIEKKSVTISKDIEKINLWWSTILYNITNYVVC